VLVMEFVQVGVVFKLGGQVRAVKLKSRCAGRGVVDFLVSMHPL
jgi:hypothetical protein